MGTHAFAIGLSALAYAMARRFANDTRFAFGTWKIEVLAGFTSALGLLAVAVAMVWESVHHLLLPQPIQFGEAMLVAALGLAVNLYCAFILGGAHHHEHGHDHAHDRGWSPEGPLRPALTILFNIASRSVPAVAMTPGKPSVRVKRTS